MALDPNIALGVRPLEIANPLAQYGQMAQLQNMQTQNQLHQMQMREAEATAQERNALRQLNPSSPDYEQQLFKVNPQLGIAYRKEASAAAAQEATRQKATIETAAAKQAMMSQAYRDISGRPSDANIMAHTEDIQESALFSPAEKQKALATQQRLLAMPVAERGAYLASQGAKSSELKPHFNVGPTGIVQTPAFGGAATIVPGAEAAFQMTPAQIATNRIAQQQLGVSQGQLGVSQGQLGVAQERLAHEKTKDTGKAAVSEQQAAYNIGRVLTAADQINKITKTDPNALKPGMGEAAAASMGMSGTANLARNANRQIVSGAQRDALDALLYLATGAAYNKEQLEGQMAAYIPSYTDAPETVAAKKTRMTDLIGSAKIRAGKAWTPQMESAMKSLTEPGASSTASGKVTPAASNVVVTPDGQSHTFPTPAAAAQFKKAAGLQ